MTNLKEILKLYYNDDIVDAYGELCKKKDVIISIEQFNALNMLIPALFNYYVGSDNLKIDVMKVDNIVSCSNNCAKKYELNQPNRVHYILTNDLDLETAKKWSNVSHYEKKDVLDNMKSEVVKKWKNVSLVSGYGSASDDMIVLASKNGCFELNNIGRFRIIIHNKGSLIQEIIKKTSMVKGLYNSVTICYLRRNNFNTYIIATLEDVEAEKKRFNDIINKFPNIQCDDLKDELGKEYKEVIKLDIPNKDTLYKEGILSNRIVVIIEGIATKSGRSPEEYKGFITSNISKEDEKDIDGLFDINKNFYNVVARDGNLFITRTDMLSLRRFNNDDLTNIISKLGFDYKNGWLNDNIITFFTNLLNREFTKNYIVNTTYFTTERFTGSDKKDIKKLKELEELKSKVFIPIFINNHWVLCVVRGDIVSFYDSLETKENIQIYTDDIIHRLRKNGDSTKDYIVSKTSSPVQPNGYDCGVYMLMNIYVLSFKDTLKGDKDGFIYDDKDITKFRNKIALSILHKKLKF